MSEQKWKTDPKLYGCDRTEDGKKKLDYETTYVKEFLDADPLMDWPSFDRCKDLWFWAMRQAKLNHTRLKEMTVLDCGAKDGQFPEFLVPITKESLGVEISDPYVQYCQERKRPVIKGDVCNLPEDWTDKWDFTFSHHIIGLVEDIDKALSEMFRVTKPEGYILTCLDIPGNDRKHYSYIENESIFQKFYENNPCEVVFNGRWNEQNFAKEWVFYLKKYE